MESKRQRRKITCRVCHKENRPHAAYGLCGACWKKENPDPKAVLRTKQWRKANPLRRQAGTYKTTTEYLQSLLVQQSGVCAVCGQPPCGRWKALCVDHDHVTGRVRGLLCSNCNIALGNFKDDPRIVARAVVYLEKPSGS